MQGMQGWSKSKRIFCLTSILTYVISWSLLRFMWEIENTENHDIAFKIYIQKSKCLGEDLNVIFVWAIQKVIVIEISTQIAGRKSERINYWKSWNCFQNRHPKI